MVISWAADARLLIVSVEVEGNDAVASDFSDALQKYTSIFGYSQSRVGLLEKIILGSLAQMA